VLLHKRYPDQRRLHCEAEVKTDADVEASQVSVRALAPPQQLRIRGLKHPNAFKQAVYTMKHSEISNKAAMENCSMSTHHLSERNKMLAMLLKKFPNELGENKSGYMWAEA